LLHCGLLNDLTNVAGLAKATAGRSGGDQWVVGSFRIRKNCGRLSKNPIPNSNDGEMEWSID